MTTLHEAAQLALEALMFVEFAMGETAQRGNGLHKQVCAAIEALRSALAQQGEQPVTLPMHETPEMHDVVMSVLYKDGATRCGTDKLWQAYRGALLASAPAPQALAQQGEQQPVKPDAYQHEDDDDSWRDVPDDCDIIESAGGAELKVGDVKRVSANIEKLRMKP